ncbi:MAG: homoaconitase [Candidatus Eisenbacteria bacterium]|nr:homoaconitase [Candidatus Latescibacterota bacterium]MBD3303080.1 homoaconitase [Candidatus Eisenbacteria bacterium]
MGQNRIEKIAERFAVGRPAGRGVRSGDFLTIAPRHVMTHDNSGAVIPKFRSIGATRVKDPAQPVFILDHDVQNESPENLAKYAAIEEFAREHGIAFFPAKSGISHQIMVEEGFVLPGTFVVGSDSHSNLYGAVGALGTPVVRTDAAAIWATGSTWWQVPEVVRVTLTGALPPGAVGKDVIIALIGFFKGDEVLNCAIEFDGDGLAGLTMDQRLTISNMTTEWGALVGLVPYDETTRAFLLARAEAMARRGDAHPRLTPETIERFERDDPQPDPDAFYAKEFTLDLSSVTPHVAGPDGVKTITPLGEIQEQKVRIDKAYLLSCVNSRLEDIAGAAEVVKGKKVADHVKMYVAAASASIEEEAKRRGHWQALLDAGAIPLPPGCGPCIGLGEGILEPGETAISATNRNFKGRMGSRDAQAYLASPAVVAASAVAGHIAAPGSPPPREIVGEIREHEAPPTASDRIEILEGFPKRIEGELVLIPKDNLNTDGIYGKEYTYKDDFPPEEMGKVAMLNYDPRFQEIAREGDLLVGGWNFGTGSSREQAATALKFRGIPLVIAGSFSQTYKRNAFNNAFPVIESPLLVRELRKRFAAAEEATIRTGLHATVDFESSRITVEGEAFAFPPLGEVAQELVALSGFEAVLRRRLGAS